MSYERYIEDALAFHEAFRKLGYQPDHIFFGVANELSTKRLMVMIQLKLPTGFSFTVPICPLESDADLTAVVDLWKAAVAKWNTSPDDSYREGVWKRSWIANHAAEFATALIQKKILWEQTQ